MVKAGCARVVFPIIINYKRGTRKGGLWQDGFLLDSLDSLVRGIEAIWGLCDAHLPFYKGERPDNARLP
jgi:hypothetical protein